VNDIVENLYRVFSRYRHPPAPAGCPCCTSPAQGKALLAARLREISTEAVRRYARKAQTTWGTVADYKYFLPRILELSMTDDPPCEVEITLSKLGYGDFQSWPHEEKEAVEDFVVSLWAHYVKGNAIDEADSVLCGAAQFMNVIPLLEQAVCIRAEFKDIYRTACARADKRRLTNSFWDRDSQMYKDVLNWVYA
jgi:hypothetical protein